MRRFICLLSCITCIVFPLLAEETEELKIESSKKPDLAQLSKALGHLIGKNFQSLGLSLDVEAFALGLKGDSEPPLSEEECLSALAAVQEENLLLAAEQSLKEANEFLAKNAKEEKIVSLEDGKVQYKVLQEGTGEAVQEYNSPVLRYEGRYLNGQLFGASHDEEVVALDESLIGFAKGVTGMREGEKRTLYIHPDLGYGQSTLLIFDVEVVKADASADAHAASNGRCNHLGMKIILFQPQIPQNAGNIARTCSVTGTDLLLVHPLGFSTASRHLKRAGLDYWDGVSVQELDNLEEYLETTPLPFFFFSSKATAFYTEASYTKDAALIFGSETTGLPTLFHEKWHDRFYRIPMTGNSRCLNLASSVAIVLYEGLRQQEFNFSLQPMLKEKSTG